jgi:hypothetical protein
MDFSGLVWLFYKLLEILLVLSSFKKKRLESLFCACKWLKFFPLRPINPSSIFSISLASACPSHGTRLDFNILGTIDHPIALAFSQQMKD